MTLDDIFYHFSQLVLQVQKVRNVAAPKANEDSQAAPRMLKLTLTDGHSYCQAIEVNPVSAISRDRTPPGSKVLVKNAKISAGYVLLQSNSCTYLGGKVPALYEKWEISKNLLKTARSASILDGPPAWVNFGAKIQSSIPDQPFKSLDNKTKDTEKQNTEFEVQRKDAIAEASTGAVRKVFGGGSKKTNNLQQQQHEISERKPRVNRERNTKERTEQKDLEKTQKPPERVSLFHFLEEKLPANEIPEAKTSFYESRSNNEHSNRKPYQKENSFPAQNHRGNKPNLTNSNKQFENVERPPRFYNNSKNYTPRTANGYVQPKPAAAAVNQNRTTASNSVDAITNNMEKVSLNSQFASRSLRQHLNLSSGSKETQKVESDSKWNVGDACLAKYWEDGKVGTLNSEVRSLNFKFYCVFLDVYVYQYFK